MIENLYDIGLEKDFVEQFINTHGYDLALNLSSNYETLEKNINLLKSCFINTNELLMYKPEMFFMETKQIHEKLKTVNLNAFIILLNEDITVIDELF